VGCHLQARHGDGERHQAGVPSQCGGGPPALLDDASRRLEQGRARLVGRQQVAEVEGARSVDLLLEVAHERRRELEAGSGHGRLADEAPEKDEPGRCSSTSPPVRWSRCRDRS
jgi:hypothetical protein